MLARSRRASDARVLMPSKDAQMSRDITPERQIFEDAVFFEKERHH